jgi:hypothetical protein
MLASSTIHQLAWGDPRIHYLQRLGGFVDVRHVMGALAMLWGRLTYLGTDTVPELEVRACIGEHGAEHLVEAGLAELLEGGLVRVRGRVDNETGKDRIGWLQQFAPRASETQRQPHKVAAGKARAATAPRVGGKFVRGAGAGPAATSSHQQPSPADQQAAGDQDPDQDQKSADSLSDARVAGDDGDAAGSWTSSAEPASTLGTAALLDPTWTPDAEPELETTAHVAGVGDLRVQLARLRDYARANPEWRLTSDRQATWRLWLHRAIDHARSQRKPPIAARGASSSSEVSSLARQALERERAERQANDERALADRQAVQRTLATTLQHPFTEKKATG